uniref:U8-hexatoxin-Mg1a n=1 Tax=Macrothele gigas TaxID=223896 RepID=TXMG7_MACGS|nr:RecName: Full=U8-hexatoxin-Mg1a; Short=U8-HXTX-Mg1a; AltName: Full=Neurotoxin magi-7; Flags: Precursor [Macrothele gigas]BAD13402.1 peptide toxin 1 precursor [Macrothele gigas]
MKVFSFTIGLVVIISLFAFALAYDEETDLMKKLVEMERAIEQRIICAPEGGPCVVGIGCCKGYSCAPGLLGLVGHCQ